jgi:hypothetical protein
LFSADGEFVFYRSFESDLVQYFYNPPSANKTQKASPASIAVCLCSRRYWWVGCWVSNLVENHKYQKSCSVFSNFARVAALERALSNERDPRACLGRTQAENERARQGGAQKSKIK